jgi:hypothetical protein
MAERIVKEKATEVLESALPNQPPLRRLLVLPVHIY